MTPSVFVQNVWCLSGMALRYAMVAILNETMGLPAALIQNDCVWGVPGGRKTATSLMKIEH